MPTKVEERLQFLRRRQEGIGGSDVPKILGYSDYGDARSVFHEKTREITREDVEAEEIEDTDLERGRDLEPKAREKYAERTGRDGRQWPERRHPDKDFFIAHVDWEVFASKANPEGMEGETGVAEFKCPSLERYDRIAEHGLADREFLQLVWYLHVTGRPWGGFGLYNPYSRRNPHLLTPDVIVGPDEKEMMRFLDDRMEEFYRKHVEERIEPDPDEWSVTDSASDVPDVIGDYVTVHPERIDPSERPEAHEAAVELLQIAQDFAEAREAKNEGKEAYKEAKKKASEWIEEYGAPIFGSRKFDVPTVGKIATVVSSGRDRFDDEALRGHRPLDRDALHRTLRSWKGEGLLPEDFGIESFLSEHELDLDRFVDEGGSYSYVRMY